MKDSPAPVTDFNLRLLQTFMLVADSLSFRSAAEQTHRSQSAGLILATISAVSFRCCRE